MHELSIAQALIELATEHAQRAGVGRVTRIHCRIGAMRQADPDCLNTAFEVARERTLCDGAVLSIERTPVRARCPNCRTSFEVENWDWRCRRCEATGDLLTGGDELELVSIEAEP